MPALRKRPRVNGLELFARARGRVAEVVEPSPLVDVATRKGGGFANLYSARI
jgi:hypothetical protein